MKWDFSRKSLGGDTKRTTALYKALHSTVNLSITFLPTIPVLWFFGPGSFWKVSWITTFLVYNLYFELKKGRCLAMMLFSTQYRGGSQHTKNQKIMYSLLYTFSFSTLFWHIFLPFDVFMFNIFVLQLPAVLLTGTTLHGYIAGGSETVHI